MKKQKPDLTVLINILFIIFLCVITLVVFFIFRTNNNPKSLDNIYQEKLADTKKAANQVLNQKKEEKKALPAFEKFKYKYTYTINFQGKISNLTFKIPIPSDKKEMQYISSANITPKPAKIYNEGENTIAEFIFSDITVPKQDIIIEGIASVRTYDLAAAKIINKNLTPEKDLTKYLNPENYIESNDMFIKNIASKIKGETKEEIIQNIYEYTQNNLKYTPIPQILGAKQALIQKKGKCSEYSAVMIALCRAKNIPARVITGNIAREENTPHNWVEVYFDQYGWVTFDPTVMATIVNIYNNGKLVRQEKRFESESSHIKYITSGKNQFSPWYVSYSVPERVNGQASVSTKIEIKKIED